MTVHAGKVIAASILVFLLALATPATSTAWAQQTIVASKMQVTIDTSLLNSELPHSWELSYDINSTIQHILRARFEDGVGGIVAACNGNQMGNNYSVTAVNGSVSYTGFQVATTCSIGTHVLVVDLYARGWSQEFTYDVTISADTTGPAISTSSVDGSSLVLTYDSALDTASTPATGDFTVTVVDSVSSSTTVHSVSNVVVSGMAVTLRLGSPARYQDTVTVDYTKGTTPIQDSAGNDAPKLSDQSVTNNTTTAMTVTLSSLSLSSVTFTFAASTVAYTATIAYSVTQTTVAATTTDSRASALISPSDDDGTTSGHQINLSVGANSIDITVTAEDGSTQLYEITLTRTGAGGAVFGVSIGDSVIPVGLLGAISMEVEGLDDTKEYTVAISARLPSIASFTSDCTETSPVEYFIQRDSSATFTIPIRGCSAGAPTWDIILTPDGEDPVTFDEVSGGRAVAITYESSINVNNQKNTAIEKWVPVEMLTVPLIERGLLRTDARQVPSNAIVCLRDCTLDNQIRFSIGPVDVSQAAVLRYASTAGTYTKILAADTGSIDLLEEVPAVGDTVTFIGATPFRALHLTLANAVSRGDGWQGIWQYWDGTARRWVTMTNVVDETRAMTVGGSKSRKVVWPFKPTLGSTTIDGVTGYAVRMMVTSVGEGSYPAPELTERGYEVGLWWVYADIDPSTIVGYTLYLSGSAFSRGALRPANGLGCSDDV